MKQTVRKKFWESKMTFFILKYSTNYGLNDIVFGRSARKGRTVNKQPSWLAVLIIIERLFKIPGLLCGHFCIFKPRIST